MKPKKEGSGSGFWYVCGWIVIGVYVHSKLWGGYDVPPEDSLPFFLIDAVVSLGIILLGLALLTGIAALWKKITGNQ